MVAYPLLLPLRGHATSLVRFLDGDQLRLIAPAILPVRRNLNAIFGHAVQSDNTFSVILPNLAPHTQQSELEDLATHA
jgi:hypothetical protein